MERKEQLKSDLEFLGQHCNQVIDMMTALERELVRIEEGGERA
ncbi:hypothetical protein [Tumebacillus flagellatus]|nr:hypothetical protein [Tumebacillus flagellatus]